MPTVGTNGIRLYYERRGRGEPLLLLPGLGSATLSYERIVDGLSRDFEVVAVDNRGSGRSDKPDAPYSMEMMADDAAGLLQALHLEPAAVLGHSMGGRIALSLTLRHPELVRSLIRVSTGPRTPPGTRRRVGWLGALSRKNPVLRRLDRDPQPYYAFVRQLEASRRFDCTARLDELRVPVLIIQGSRDRLAPPAIAEEMHARLAGSRMITLPGGHLVFFMRREACVKAISECLAMQGTLPRSA